MQLIIKARSATRVRSLRAWTIRRTLKYAIENQGVPQQQRSSRTCGTVGDLCRLLQKVLIAISPHGAWIQHRGESIDGQMLGKFLLSAAP